MQRAVVAGYSAVLAHTPELVRYGSKPTRELAKDGDRLPTQLAEHLRSYENATAYLPNQVFIGGMHPDILRQIPRPWFNHPAETAQRFTRHGEIMPQDEFYGLMKIVDQFDLVHLDPETTTLIREKLQRHPLITEEDLGRLGTGTDVARIDQEIASHGVALFLGGDLVGCVRRGHEEDETLSASILLENLSCKASGVLALRNLLAKSDELDAPGVEYLINTGEEAVGDRYQRGGGNLAKAIGESCGCIHATGADVKAFCCAPIHALVLAASLVQAEVYSKVVVIGGGAMAKLGMKFRGHLDKDMPILEDVLGAFAILVTPDDGVSPIIRTDVVGRHEISSGSSAQAIYESLVARPLEKFGMKITEIDKYALELHNPEVTEPAGSGDVPKTNYRMIAALAAKKGEISPKEIDQFVERHGMVGFSPTQGHIPAGVPFMGHARDMMLAGDIERAMFVAKGSLFLGMMTTMADGMSVLIEKNSK